MTVASGYALPGDAVFDAEGRPLDRQEGICDPRAGKGCLRWPEDLWFVSTEGELVRGRCKATNLCPYCQRLYVAETVEMLLLDAAEWPPSIWVVLTAREHLTRLDTYGHLRQLRKWARKRWPAEWFVQVEFQRRGALHLNLLVKGVPTSDLELLHELLVARWCARVDAEPVGQWSGLIGDAGGLAKYLAKTLGHGLKAEQAPPLGWRGHRTSQTRGYLVRPAAELRIDAQESLFEKRALSAATRLGLVGDQAEDFVDGCWDRRINVRWGIWQQGFSSGARSTPPRRDLSAPEGLRLSAGCDP